MKKKKSFVPTWIDATDDEDVVVALQHDIEGDVVARSSAFALPVQNRFSVLDSTIRDNDDLMSTAVDGSGVDVFP